MANPGGFFSLADIAAGRGPRLPGWGGLLCLLSVLVASALRWLQHLAVKLRSVSLALAFATRPSGESQHHDSAMVILLHCRQAALLRAALWGPSLALMMPGPSPWHTQASRF